MNALLKATHSFKLNLIVKKPIIIKLIINFFYLLLIIEVKFTATSFILVAMPTVIVFGISFFEHRDFMLWPKHFQTSQLLKLN
jgi:hypothetical protein